MSTTIFVSVVSSEFHHKDPQRPMSFESYRDILTRSLRRQIPGCEVIVQEELKQGTATCCTPSMMRCGEARSSST